MSEMVERVRKAIKAEYENIEPDRFIKYGLPEEAMARAALKAMRVPTEKMAILGWEESRPHSIHEIYRDALFEAYKDEQIEQWQAMIDEALEEPEE